MDTHASLLELAPGAAGQARITAIRAVAQRRGATLVRVRDGCWRSWHQAVLAGAARSCAL